MISGGRAVRDGPARPPVHSPHIDQEGSFVDSHWISGECWLGCERTGLPVIWLGPVQWDGQHAPFLACADCLARLKAQALAYFMQRQPAIA